MALTDRLKKTESWKRIIDLEQGVAMVVTDLHGDWAAYERYRDRFLQLKEKGEADYLILTGDLIHYDGPATNDGSLQIVQDVLRLKATLRDQLICLLGSHEMPHIYSITLQKGDCLYTSRFEAAMGEQRSRILTFFRSLPFYVRTRAGVTIAHAGATTAVSKRDGRSRLFNYSHKRILRETAEAVTIDIRPSMRAAIAEKSGIPYEKMVRDYLAVSSCDDPRYDDFLIGAMASTSHPDFKLLWMALFTRNEEAYGHKKYALILQQMLEALSSDYHTQKFMVAGHNDCTNGYKRVNARQLRLASAKHALPRESGTYLLFDMGKPVESVELLMRGLDSVF